MPIEYPKSDSPFFSHTESQSGDVRIKITSVTLKAGQELGGIFSKNPQEQYLVYKIMRPNREELEWTVKAGSQVGKELAKNNIQEGDVVVIKYLGNIMPTDYGNKAKYEIQKENSQPQQPQQPQQQPEEEVNIKEDF